MKRLIFILAVVCTVFIGFGSVASAYEKGDTVAGVTLASDFPECSDYMVLGDTLYLLNGRDLYVDTTRNNRIMSNTVGLWRIETDGTCGSLTSFNTFWFYFNDISKSSFNVKDENGNVVFSLSPPVEYPILQPGLEGITTEFLLMMLQELKPIVLVLLVAVIGFLAFRKAWNWLVVQFSRG